MENRNPFKQWRQCWIVFALLMFCCMGFTPNLAIAASSDSFNALALRAPSEVLPSWSQSIVKIWFDCGAHSGSGAGVIVTQRGLVLTAAHVGRGCDADQTSIQVGRINSPYSPPLREFNAKLLERWTDNLANPSRYDLALLKIEQSPGQSFPAIAFSERLPLPGDPVSIVGFSDLPFQPLATPPQEANLSIFKTALISVAADEQWRIPVRLHYGGGSLSGMSGGAVLDQSGMLIGIHSGRTTANLTQLLNQDCQEIAYQRNQCDGNALRVDYRDPIGTPHTQVIHLDYLRLKSMLENYSWATGIARIPPHWLKDANP